MDRETIEKEETIRENIRMTMREARAAFLAKERQRKRLEATYHLWIRWFVLPLAIGIAILFIKSL